MFLRADMLHWVLGSQIRRDSWLVCTSLEVEVEELIMSGNNSSTYVVDKHFQYSHWNLKKGESEWRHRRNLDLTLTQIGANACSTILTGWWTYRYMKATIRLSRKISYSILVNSRASHVAPVQDELSQTQTFGATQTPRKSIIPYFYSYELCKCGWGILRCRERFQHFSPIN